MHKEACWRLVALKSVIEAGKVIRKGRLRIPNFLEKIGYLCDS